MHQVISGDYLPNLVKLSCVKGGTCLEGFGRSSDTRGFRHVLPP